MAKNIDSLAGNDMIIIRTWNLSVFIFLISFVVLFVFFYTFQPPTLLGTRDWLYGAGKGGGVRKTNTDSENKVENRWLSDRGRTIVFAWSIGLAAAVGLFFHFVMIYYN